MDSSAANILSLAKENVSKIYNKSAFDQKLYIGSANKG